MEIKKLFLIIIAILSYVKCKEEDISFTVVNITISQVSCFPYLGTYLFYITGQFNKPPKITNTITFNLDTPVGSTVTCYALDKTPVSPDQFQCTIDLCDYPINNQNITLPVNPPSVSGYSFPNWKEIIGVEPGISNLVPEYDIKCTPQEINSYTISSIKSEGCSKNENIITIDGKWYDESQLTPDKFNIKTTNGNLAKCHY